MEVEEMIAEINRFIDQYDGTAIGASIYNKLSNANKDDYDAIEKIYEEVESF